MRVAAFEADLSSYENARKLCDEVVEVLGHPDILFSNHGVTGPRIGPEGDMQAVSAEAFEEIWRTNTGTGYVVRHPYVCGFKPLLADTVHPVRVARSKVPSLYARETMGPYHLHV